MMNARIEYNQDVEMPTVLLPGTPSEEEIDELFRLLKIVDEQIRFPLDRCPFCGGKAWLVHANNGMWKVKCKECASESPMRTYREDCVEIWNRRI